MAPILTLHQGDQAKTYRDRPRHEAETRAVRAVVVTMQEQCAGLPRDSKVREWLDGWSQRMTQWANEGA